MPIARPFWDPEHEEAARGAAPQAFGHDFHLALGPIPEEEITVVSFRATEAVNELYSAEILFVVGAESHADPLADALGSRARLTFPSPERPRALHGIAADLALVGAHGDRRVYAARVVPEIWRLTKRTDTRVFQGQTVAQIVAEVLGEHHIPHVPRLSGSYAPRRYCLQYAETDFAFIARLLAEEGIAFWFEQPGAGGGEGEVEVLVLADSEAFYQPLAGGDRLAFRPDAGALGGTSDDVLTLRVLRGVQPGMVSLRSYDHGRAAPPLGRAVPTPPPGNAPTLVGGVISVAAEAAGTAAGPLEEYDPHGHHHEVDLTAMSARTRLEQHRALASAVAGTSACGRLVPGATVRVEGHDVLPEGDELALVRVVHRGTSLVSAPHRYRNELVAVPARVLCRPPYPERRILQVVETAVVVGPEGQEIDPDHLGCVRVQFHWDRHGRNDERSSCWIRVMQPWSGPTYGFQFIPRVGTEVLVSFVGGDPDRPIILGCLPNPANAVPYPLPEHATRSGIRTRTSPGTEAGHNELMFEDRRGEELVHLRAQRNHEELVLQDQQIQVGRDQRERVGQDRTAEIGRDEVLRVGGARRSEIGGNAITVVGGDEQARVAGSRIHQAGGDAHQLVSGEMTFKVGGAARIVAGTREESDIMVQGSGEIRVLGARGVRLHSPTSIELICGGSRVSITPEGITLKARRVQVEAEDDVTVQRAESKLTVGEAVEAESATVTLTTASASLALGQGGAELRGNPVALKGPEGAQRSRPESQDATPGEARFKVEPPSGHEGPLTLVIATPSGEVIERQTDGNHEVVLEGFEGDRFELVEVKLPGGERLQHLPAEG